MPTLRPCSRCGSHVRNSEASCPFCDAPMPARGVGAAGAVVLVGLALAGCEKKGGGPVAPVEPEYGVPVSDSAGVDDGGMPSDEGGMPSDEGGAPGDEGGMPSDDGGVEPEYGVPATPIEAEYGGAEQG